MSRVVRGGLGALPAVAAAMLAPGIGSGQQPDCRLVAVGGYTHSQRFISRFGPSEYRHHASGGVDYRCSDGTRVQADSAVVFESDNQVQLYGRVRFEDPDTELLADSALYFSSVRQLRAMSNVVVTDRASGTVIRGENLIYNQASEFRTLDRMDVYGGQPRATFFVAPAPAPEEAPQPDSGQGVAAPPDPDSGQATDPPAGPDSAQAGPPPAEEDPEPPAEEPPTEEPVEDSLAPAAEPADTVPPVPYDIVAERFRFEGRRYFRAGGQVEIVRDSLQAFGDSLDYDQQGGVMVVFGSARFLGQGYTLTGATISVTPSSSQSEEIVAREEAHLTGRQVDMRAPAIRLFVDGGNVDRLVALAEVPPLPGADEQQEVDTRGLSPGDAQRARELAGAAGEGDDPQAVPDSLLRPVVLAQDFELTGDSIEVKSPGQRLDQVVAAGDARAESADRDSLRTGSLPPVARRDWMVGDTIIARFGPSSDSAAAADPPPADSAPRLETLTAIGNARSLYRMFSSDTTEVGAEPRPALHLVEGEEITIHLEGREVVNMDVVGQTEGWHFEPLPPDSAVADSAAVDSTGARPDSAAIDTTGAKPDTTAVDAAGAWPTPSAVARPEATDARSAGASPGAVAGRRAGAAPYRTAGSPNGTTRGRRRR